ncbi:uncharacterized protein LOC121370654 isoform X2 [Gigantopelta aegis]|uniref:uncharacterized protein LOC121370654 isoform X2 n=1 Tax=Gigantopelta aegis TaxID=1735272 RepID=UPI001B88B120|nr:uncharacterized protein LOC121370654 isoform X2 [Gigantopelta aegis]
MELLYLSAFASIVCTFIFLSFRYLSLLRWISGQAYVFSKSQEHFTAEEVMDLLKTSKPFPVSCQKGWKIDHVSHGHRVWFNFLTVPHNLSTASIKVFSSFCHLRASPQMVLQVLKDITLRCEWKPGVVASSSVRGVSSLEISTKLKGVTSLSVKHDIIMEERICSPRWSRFDTWWESNVTETTTQQYKRYWHREDNGCCWFLQVNEQCQSWEFYVTQPVEEMDHSLVTIITWTRDQHHELLVDTAAAVLCSLKEYLLHRKILSTPFVSISLPEKSLLPISVPENAISEAKPETKRYTKLFSKFKDFLERTTQGTSSLESQRGDFKRYSSILHFQTSATTTMGGEVSSIKDSSGSDVISQSDGDSQAKRIGTAFGNVTSENDDVPKQEKSKKSLQRSISDFTGHRPELRHTDRQQTPESVEEDMETTDPVYTKYKVQANQAAAELLAQVLQASNIQLDKSLEDQLEASGGWTFYSFDSEVVVLKRNFKNGVTVQSYLGKGLIHAPARTVWDAVRNPRTRFTYDETLKNVDILESIGSSMKIVHLYHEVLQMLKKAACDICLLQSERVEGEKYILTYESIDDRIPHKPGTVRAKVLPSGWIIEPVKKDRKICSMVTYLMQIDFGPAKSNSERFPFEEMVARQPLSIAFLEQYLKPAVMMARRKSAPAIDK